MGKFQWIEHTISRINEKLGEIVSFFLIIIMFNVLFEVASRYLFNSPTIWAWDVSIQLFAALVFLGGGYHFLHHQIIISDIFYTRFSTKWKRVFDMISFIAFLVFFVVLLWQSSDMAWRSIVQREHDQSILGAPLYPIRTIMAIGVLLMLLQWGVMSIRNFITDMSDIRSKSNGH